MIAAVSVTTVVVAVVSVVVAVVVAVVAAGVCQRKSDINDCRNW